MTTWHGIELPADAPAIGTTVRPEFAGSTSAVVIEVQPCYTSSDVPEETPDTWAALVQEYKGKRAAGPAVTCSASEVIARIL